MSNTRIPSHSLLKLTLFLGVTAASTAAILIRFTQQEGASAIVIAAMRLSIASLILSPYSITRYHSVIQRLSRREWMLVLLSGLFLAVHFAAWITSLQYTTVASSAVLVATTPLWVAALSPIVLHEQLNTIGFVGLLLALLGGVIIGISDICVWQAGAVSCPPLQSFMNRSSFLGDLLALAGAGMAAGYMLVGRKLRSKMELVPYIFLVYGMAALILLVIMLGKSESPVGLPPVAFLWFFLLAVVPQLFGHSTLNWALKFLPASFVSVILLAEPVGSTILAYFIFQEIPGWIKFFGGLMILAGIWLVARK
jgi:drug/metabolite transporter (DMT)-like permease